MSPRSSKARPSFNTSFIGMMALSAVAGSVVTMSVAMQASLFSGWWDWSALSSQQVMSEASNTVPDILTPSRTDHAGKCADPMPSAYHCNDGSSAGATGRCLLSSEDPNWCGIGARDCDPSYYWEVNYCSDGTQPPPDNTLSDGSSSVERLNPRPSGGGPLEDPPPPCGCDGLVALTPSFLACLDSNGLQRPAYLLDDRPACAVCRYSDSPPAVVMGDIEDCPEPPAPEGDTCPFRLGTVCGTIPALEAQLLILRAMCPVIPNDGGGPTPEPESM